MENYSLNQLVITERALEKIQAYSKIVCEEGNRECYGFLLNPRNKNDLIVYNAILAFGQIVNRVSAEVDSHGVLDSKAEIENLGYSAIGCWHSHHEMGAFHSTTDNKNLEKLVNVIACNREKLLKKGIEDRKQPKGNNLLIRKNGVEINIEPLKQIVDLTYTDVENKQYFVNIGTDERLIYFDLNGNKINFKYPEEEKPISVGFAYSLVVGGNKIYAEVAVREACNTCGNNNIKRKPVELKIIKIDNDISFTEQELRGEIKRKIKRRKFFDFF